MKSHRLRGLLNLHVVATAAVATSYFLAAALAVQYFPLVLDLSAEVNLLLYSLPILLGLLFSGRFWDSRSAYFHSISWFGAMAISARQILAVALLIFALIVATKDRAMSRLFLATYLVTCSMLLVVFNRYFPRYLARMVFGRSQRIPTVFFGPQRAMGTLKSWIRQQDHLGIALVGLLSDDPETEGTSPYVRLGPTAALPAVLRDHNIGQVVMLELPKDAEETQRVVSACQEAGARLLVYQDYWDRLPIPMVPVIEDKHLFLTVHDEPLEDPLNRAVKRTYDILVSLPVVLFLLPPLCLLVWVVQRWQAPGPLMFSRIRGGQRRREFSMLKFRSMYAAQPDRDLEARQARPGDPRIYPFGHFLRRTSLDEFPQFWNVLMGDMSIVGPRPHLPAHDDEFSRVAKTYRTRQLVKPGITGLAQVSGYRGEITDPQVLERRVQMDIDYITRWSPWLDVEITFRTLSHVFVPPSSAR